eukprot:Rhum_TRINITY_DN15250_c0_g3::Rhum_TRINITY_DN15250_c0_g3_i2::g.146050::m.146050
MASCAHPHHPTPSLLPPSLFPRMKPLHRDVRKVHSLCETCGATRSHPASPQTLGTSNNKQPHTMLRIGRCTRVLLARCGGTEAQGRGGGGGRGGRRGYGAGGGGGGNGDGGSSKALPKL